MPMSLQSVTVTQPVAGTILFAIGPETFTFPLEELRAIWNGKREPLMAVFQCFLSLRAAGINPNTATLGQMKAAIEAQQIWWGN